MKLKFIHKEKIARDSWELMFEKPDGFVYEPGQYLETNLKHPKVDSRGIKRWFTMSSSPTEGDIMLTMRFIDKHSSFKQALIDLEPADEIEAIGPQGNFLLPSERNRPIVWIAGGIGITPFRSQLKFLLDNHQLDRDITLIYSNHTKQDICFEDLWSSAAKLMPKFNLVMTLVDDIPKDWAGEVGLVDEAMILRAIGSVGKPGNSAFYISGPEPMVEAFGPKLIEMGVAEADIKQDWFPNYTDEFFKV